MHASVTFALLRHYGLQPTRFLCPWDSPGKNTGVGCHFLLQRMKVKSESEVAQLCPTLSDPMDCSLPGSSVHGIFQARVLSPKYCTRWNFNKVILCHHIAKGFPPCYLWHLMASPASTAQTAQSHLIPWVSSSCLCYAPIPLSTFSAVVSVEFSSLLWITIILPTESELHYGLCRL